MSMRSRGTHTTASQRGFTNIELVISIGLIALIGVALWPILRNAHESSDRSGCVNNLRQLGLVLALYANENRDMFPPLDQRPGNLIFDGDVVFPEFLSNVDVLGCPSDPRFDPKRSFRLARTGPDTGDLRVGEVHPACIDTTSYMYTGCILLTDSDVRAYASGEDFSSLMTGAYTAEEAAVNVPADGEPWFADSPAWPNESAARMNTPTGSTSIPVIWDRPAIEQVDFAHRPRGQNVLYLDGHVEFHRLAPDNGWFPTSAYSHAWMAALAPAPAGAPGDAWANCTDYVSVLGRAVFEAQQDPA